MDYAERLEQELKECRAVLADKIEEAGIGRLYLYKTLGNDDEGDALDFGNVRAASEEEAVRLVIERFEEIFEGIDPDDELLWFSLYGQDDALGNSVIGGDGPTVYMTNGQKLARPW